MGDIDTKQLEKQIVIKINKISKNIVGGIGVILVVLPSLSKEVIFKSGLRQEFEIYEIKHEKKIFR